MELCLSLAQISVTRSNPAENLKKAEIFIEEAAKNESDLICFPEMWTTGFDWVENKKIAESQNEIIDQISSLAKKHKIWINGSMLALNEDNKVSNTSILFDSDGKKAGVYRKIHLFSYMNEDKHMTAGDSLCLVDTPWGLTGLAICYDIRFPELFCSYAVKGAKIILSPMAFPYPRIEHWKILSRARAIENQLFFVGTNQVGKEDFGQDGEVTYFGDSSIIDPWGRAIVEAYEEEEQLLTATIDMDQVDQIRKEMTVLKDRRPDVYEKEY